MKRKLAVIIGAIQIVNMFFLSAQKVVAACGDFSATTIVSSFKPHAVSAADVDGDGDIDIIANEYDDHTTFWFENDGSESFTPQFVGTGSSISHSIVPIDLDQDGDLDIAVGDLLSPIWYENNGSEVFTKSTFGTLGLNNSLTIIDVDGDGDLDAVSSSGQFISSDGKILWFENDGSENFSTNTITSEDASFYATATDLDDNGDVDVLTIDSSNVVWYENNGSESFSTTTVASSIGSVIQPPIVVDLDGDSDNDFLLFSTTSDTLTWYENDGSETFTPDVISSTADAIESAYVIDLDNDGDMDIVTAASGDSELAWYENDGSENFTKNSIATLTISSSSGYQIVSSADIDDDTDGDIVFGSFTSSYISWYDHDCPISAEPVPDLTTWSIILLILGGVYFLYKEGLIAWYPGEDSNL